MGFHVSTLHNLPSGGIRYFVHVLDNSGGTHAKWIEQNLHALAHGFGPNAGLVVGPEDLTTALYQFLERHVQGDFGAVEALLSRATCLVISEGHLAHTQRPVYLLPLALPESTNEAHNMIETLLKMLAEAIQANALEKMIVQLGATRLGLSTAGGGFIVCSLRHIGQTLELKPNMYGLGVNLNAVIEKLLPPAVRKM